MLGPLACLVLGVASILFFILVLRLHAFFALIISALLVAFLSDRVGWDAALFLVIQRFYQMVLSLGALLVLAALIGKCLMDSGAAERIVRTFTRIFGPGRETYSLLSSGFVLSIPVFFDTVFYLLSPLARAVYARQKRDYVLIVCSAAAGAAVTHALVPPTPGPIMVSEQLGVSLGITIGVGILASIVPVLVGSMLYTPWINRRMPVVPGEVFGVSEAELEAISQKKDQDLPGTMISFLPFLLPVILIAFSTFMEMHYGKGHLPVWIRVVGDKNMAFLGGALLAVGLLMSQKQHPLFETASRLGTAVKSGLIIVFITSAGGAFGKVLAAAGIGDLISDMAKQWGISLFILAYLVSTLIRVAQGSATVAMITTAGIIAPALEQMQLPYHPVYLVCVIGFGATGISWMNDSGFWIFSRLTGLNEKETLKTWTVLLTVMSLSGFLWVWVLTWLLPLTP